MNQVSIILLIAGIICILESAVRLKKPDLRFFQIRQTEALEPEQRREFIRKGAVASICLGAVCFLGAALYGRIGSMKVLGLLLGGILLFLIYSVWLNKKYLASICLGAVCFLGAALYGRIGSMKVLGLLLGGILLFLIYSVWLNKKYLGNFTLLSGVGKKERTLYFIVVVVLYAVVYWGFYRYSGLLNHSLAMFLIMAGILLAAQIILFRKKK